MRAGSARLRSVPIELRVREVGWYLGRNAAGHLNEATNVSRFMRQEAKRIVEIALEVAAPSAVPAGGAGGGGAGAPAACRFVVGGGGCGSSAGRRSSSAAEPTAPAAAAEDVDVD